MDGDGELARARWRAVDRDVLLASLAALSLALVLQVTPARDGVTLLGRRLPEVCATKRLFDVDCPGCGLTRSFVVGARGDLAGAARLHPLGAVLLLFTAAQVPYRLVRLLRAPRAAHGPHRAPGRAPGRAPDWTPDRGHP